MSDCISLMLSNSDSHERPRWSSYYYQIYVKNCMSSISKSNKKLSYVAYIMDTGISNHRQLNHTRHINHTFDIENWNSPSKSFGCVSFQLKPSRRLAQTTKFSRQNLRDVLLVNSFETHPNHLQRRYAYRGDSPVLSAAGWRRCTEPVEVSEPDAGGHESIAVVCARLCTAPCHRILKLSRTIADLAGSDEIQSTHLAEALHASQSSKNYDGVVIL